MSEEEDNEHLKQLYTARQDYIKFQNDQTKQFDQNIFVISSAIFGITFTFMTNIVNSPIQNTKWIIIIGWALMLVNIVFSLFSLLYNYYAYKENINALDFRITSIKNEKEEIIPRITRYTKSEFLNILNLIIFSLSLVFIIIYIGINYIGGTYVKN